MIKSNKMLTLNLKCWMSRAIRKSMKIRYKRYKQYCKKNTEPKKELLHQQFKTCRNNSYISKN